MNARPYWHLAWKEYRAIRAFWLALVGMVALAEWLAITINHSPSAVTWVFNLALAAPAFFAVGAAGIAFAIEREEGTLDFLRRCRCRRSRCWWRSWEWRRLRPWLCIYCSGRWRCFSRVIVCQNQLRWPTCSAFGSSRRFEAIAWGTLFSLFSSRPLLAICLAIFGVSTLTPLLLSIILLAIFFAQGLFGHSLVAHLLDWHNLGPLGSFYLSDGSVANHDCALRDCHRYVPWPPLAAS